MSGDFFLGVLATFAVLLVLDLAGRSPHVCDFGPWMEEGAHDKTTPELYRLGLRVVKYQRCHCGQERYIVGKAE